MLAGADVIAVLVAAVGAGNVYGGLPTTLWVAALLPLWIVIAKVQGLYDMDHGRIKHLTTDELPSLFYWATLSVAATTLILSFGPSSTDASAAVVMWFVSLTLSFSLRVLARGVWRRLVPAERGLVIGDGPVAASVARKLQLEPGHHLELVGAADASVAHLAATIEHEGIERVVLAVTDLDERTLADVIGTCRTLGVKLSVAPPLRAMLGTAVRLNHLAELPFIEFKTWDPSRSTQLLKRAFDLSGATILLIALSPLFLLVALAIRIDSRGPAFFRQRRSGRGGRTFTMIKFRTMVRDAETRLPELVRLDELAEPMFKLRDDPRVTRLGAVLRRWSIDELPQVVNVARGDMSLVGPRPEETRLVARYDSELSFREEMRPGITGPMQIHGRGELNFQERVAVEREYVENYSLRKDLQILVKTLPAVLRRDGAF